MDPDSESGAAARPTVPAFKEWSLVCDALAEGHQSLLLRKGGIHEGRGGFAFEHPEFVLFRTAFHAQAEALKPSALAKLGVGSEWNPPAAEPATVRVDLFAETVAAGRITEWRVAGSLGDLHGWTAEVVRERFDYDGAAGLEEGCLHAALVRVYRLAQPWEFPYRPSFGGCRSWVQLPDPPESLLEGRVPVVGDDEFAGVAAALAARAGIGAEVGAK